MGEPNVSTLSTSFTGGGVVVKGCFDDICGYLDLVINISWIRQWEVRGRGEGEVIGVVFPVCLIIIFPLEGFMGSRSGGLEVGSRGKKKGVVVARQLIKDGKITHDWGKGRGAEGKVKDVTGSVVTNVGG